MTSIRAHLIGRLLVITAILFGAADVLIWYSLDRVLDANLDGSLLAKAKARAALVYQDEKGLEIDWNGLDQVNRNGGNPDIVQLLDGKGRPLKGHEGIAIPVPNLENDVAYWELAVAGQGMYRIIALRFVPHTAEASQGQLADMAPCIMLVATNRDALDPHARMTTILAGVTVLALLANCLFIFREVNRGMAPLNTFGARVAEIDAKSLERRLDTDALPKELMPIAEKLNSLLERLHSSFERERHFSADVSHELRTPIAELRLLSEVMLRQPGLGATTATAFREVNEISSQMNTLVTVLLAIVRNDEDGTRLETRRVQLCETIRRTWKLHEARSQGRSLKVAFEMPDVAWVMSEDRLLQIILNNLFSNAVSHSPTGSTITVRVEQDGKTTGLTIENDCTDLVPQDLQYLFDRFWRKDKVRAASEHLGLGLSLTRILCQRLGIDLTASMPVEGKLRIALTFQPFSAPMN